MNFPTASNELLLITIFVVVFIQFRHAFVHVYISIQSHLLCTFVLFNIPFRSRQIYIICIHRYFIQSFQISPSLFTWIFLITNLKTKLKNRDDNVSPYFKTFLIWTDSDTWLLLRTLLKHFFPFSLFFQVSQILSVLNTVFFY